MIEIYLFGTPAGDPVAAPKGAIEEEEEKMVAKTDTKKTETKPNLREVPNTTPSTEMRQYDPGLPEESNYFETYGNTVSQTAIVGTLLKFNKGDWLLGKDDEEAEEGRRFTAIMDRLDIGWVKWVDSKPEEQRMGRLIEGFRPPKRKELGDDDQEEWEVDNAGKPRDPWQFTNLLILRTPGTTGEDDDDLFTFSTSSRGGLNAVGELCKVFGKAFRMRPDEWPIIELGVNKYKHSNKEFGIIKIPTLAVVGWEPKVPAPKLAAPKGAPAKRASGR